MHASRFHAPQLPDIPTPKAGGQGGWARRVPQRRCWRRRSAPNSKIPECARPAIRTRDWRLKAGDPALRAAPRLGRLALGIPPPAPHLIGRRHRPCSARHPSQSPYAAAPPRLVESRTRQAGPPCAPQPISGATAAARRCHDVSARLTASLGCLRRQRCTRRRCRGSHRRGPGREAAFAILPSDRGRGVASGPAGASSGDRAVGETADGGPAGVPPCVGGVGEARGAGTCEWGAGGPGMRALRRI